MPRYQPGEQLQASASFIDDPGGNAKLQSLELEQRQVTLKGFSNPVTISRINPQTSHDETC